MLPKDEHRRAAGSQYNVWVEHGHKRIEVTAERGGQESVDNFSLAAEIDVRNRGRCLYPDG